MKKILIITLLVSALAIGWPLRAVHADPFQDEIRGYVRDNGNAVANARVHIRCTGGYNVVAVTDISGLFSVTFAPDMCKRGSNLHFSTAVGDKHSVLHATTTSKITTVIMDLVPIAEVPEYGWLAGIATGGAAIGTIAYVRRRTPQGAELRGL